VLRPTVALRVELSYHPLSNTVLLLLGLQGWHAVLLLTRAVLLELLIRG
jgi:hypothetical protein